MEILRDQLEDAAAEVVKSKLRIGELEATNEFLHKKLDEASSKTNTEKLRALVI